VRGWARGAWAAALSVGSRKGPAFGQHKGRRALRSRAPWAGLLHEYLPFLPLPAAAGACPCRRLRQSVTEVTALPCVVFVSFNPVRAAGTKACVSARDDPSAVCLPVQRSGWVHTPSRREGIPHAGSCPVLRSRFLSGTNWLHVELE